MDKGTKVYRAYISTTPDIYWIDTGVISEIVVDGQPLVRTGNSLVPYADKWKPTRAAAQRDIHFALVRHIGRLQAKADEMAAEILHADLTTEEAAA